jgi:2-iminobutanoate/2-iminopropanoate deaminase
MGLLLVFLAVLAPAAELQPIFPAGVKPVGPYSPGIRSGSFVYVSGQGAQKPDGSFPSGAASQTQQCLENVKTVLEAAGLTMRHVVHAQVFLTDMSAYEEMNRVWASYFTGDRPPTRAVIGVARMPLDTAVEISAVAVTEPDLARLVRPRGYAPQAATALAVRAQDRLYISGLLGRRADTNRLPGTADDQVKLAVEHLRIVLRAARKSASDLNLATVYITEGMDTGVVERRLTRELPSGYTLVRTAALPLGTNVEIVAISAPDLRVESARGATADILRGFGDLRSAVVSNVYIDAIENFAAMNQSYAASFGEVRPARTTVQPLRAGAVNQITVVSVK